MQTLVQVNTDIDAAIQDFPPKNITTGSMRAILKKLTTFVDDLTTNKLSAWFKVGVGTPTLNATDDVYRTGKVFVGKSTDDGSGAALQADTLSIYGVQFLGASTMLTTEITDFDTLTKVGTYVIGGSTWGAGLHSPGNAFSSVFVFGTLVVNRSSLGGTCQMYFDNAQNYMYLRTKWGGNAWGAWASPNRPTELTINNALSFDVVTANRKISLYPGTNDHQFFGFGISPATLRYQIADINGSHTFFAGTSPATSAELARIFGDGRVSIGSPTPGARNSFEVLRGGWSAFLGNVAGANALPSSAFGVSMAYNRSGGSGESHLVLGTQSASAFLDFATYDGTTYTSRGRMDATGQWGFNVVPTSMVHIKGVTGHQQLRLETDYTPTGWADVNGAIGQVCFDANYNYKKSAAGWKRSPIYTTF